MNEIALKLADFLWAGISGLIGIVWWMLHNKIDSHNEVVKEQMMNTANGLGQRITDTHAILSKRIDECNHESDTQRGHIAKLFDKLDDMRGESQQRHIELLSAIHLGLDKKADK
jgi:hypothetical protein